MLAKLTPGVQQGQLPGLAGSAAAAGAAGAGPSRSTLPGGISIQQLGQQQGGMQQGQASPASSSMGHAPPGQYVPAVWGLGVEFGIWVLGSGLGVQFRY